ncbi:dihydropteroate synthase [Aquibium sp. LZ166]|uniref:Dihydropteroate synthase n=1 Tax=Aquibium pacificus TaxID=3153579 RepID=A0ABV3SQR4_9HYPH
MTDWFSPRRWRLAHGRELVLGPKAVIMGILNVTPDSFSDGGRFLSASQAIEQAIAMSVQGAAIIDVGGESTRPGSAAVGSTEEQDRILPVIEALAARGDVLISIDTYRAESARVALNAGAHIVNDVWGLQRDLDLASICQAAGAGVVLMHNSRERRLELDPVADQHVFLDRSLNLAKDAGIEPDRIVLDPGFGFGKEKPELNFELMRRFEELHAFGFPLLAGTSRKRFIGHATGREAADRDAGTAATSAILRLKGAAIFRVHDVAMNIDALRVADAMLAAPAGA